MTSFLKVYSKDSFLASLLVASSMNVIMLPFEQQQQKMQVLRLASAAIDDANRLAVSFGAIRGIETTGDDDSWGMDADACNWVYEPKDGQYSFDTITCRSKPLACVGAGPEGSCNDMGSIDGSVTAIRLSGISGTVDLTVLPINLQWLEITNSPKLDGTVDLGKLPMTLKRLVISNTDLSGDLDLTQLPPSLEYLDLSNNRFSGVPDLSKLPSTLTDLFLSGNIFAANNLFPAAIDLTQLSINLQSFQITQWPPAKLCFVTGSADVLFANNQQITTDLTEKFVEANMCPDIEDASTAASVGLGVGAAVAVCVVIGVLLAAFALTKLKQNRNNNNNNFGYNSTNPQQYQRLSNTGAVGGGNGNSSAAAGGESGNNNAQHDEEIRQLQRQHELEMTRLRQAAEIAELENNLRRQAQAQAEVQQSASSAIQPQSAQSPEGGAQQ